RTFSSVSHSASVDKEGNVHLTIANLSCDEDKKISLRLDGCAYALCDAQILTGEMNAKNDFDSPENVKIVPFVSAKIEACACGTEVEIELPKVSVLSLTFKK
ncbi:MAG: alpha-N-arabinofuranosidase, partial [Clostridia bacterium]|nr:alpha-N-arabinofuranosidase [Clostridia bacterium]